MAAYKPSPVPNALTKPFWDACNEGKLVVQTCTACSRRQHPPQAACAECGSNEKLEFLEVGGRGKIHGYLVSYDSRVMMLQAIQPFNLAVVELEDDPDIKMLSHLPGSKTDDVPVGTAVQVEFEETFNGQKVAEWRVVS